MPEPDISALIQNHPELVDFEPLLEIIKKEISPPTLREYRHTIQRLLDLQDSLGRGWTLLIATEHYDQLEVLIELLDVIEDFDEAPTPTFRQTTNHPIWAALVTVPPGYRVTTKERGRHCFQSYLPQPKDCSGNGSRRMMMKTKILRYCPYP